MNEPNRAQPTGCSTSLFGALAVWLFIFGHAFDDVRHHTENLFLVFVVPVLYAVAAGSVSAGRWFWYQFPNLAPRHSEAKSSGLSILAGILVALILAWSWAKSPLFALVYDSGKIVLLILLSGLLLGMIHRVGGGMALVLSLLAGALSVVTAFLGFLAVALLFGDGGDTFNFTLMFGSIGVPYVVGVILYDCYRKAASSLRTSD